jgi:hypothetical protein
MSSRLRSLLHADPTIVVSFLAPIELESAIARRSRGRNPEVRRLAAVKLDTLEAAWG